MLKTFKQVLLITMSPRRGYSREEVLKLLHDFHRDSGRPPRRNEPGFGKIVTAAEKEFGSWGYALQIAGLQSYKQWRKKRTLGAKVASLLNENPLTYREIKSELSKDVDSNKSLLASPKFSGELLQNCSGIKSIGPRKSKVYFLEGQEVLAQTKLDSILSEVTEDEEILFCLLKKPMSKKEILNNFQGRERKCEILLKELISANLVYPAEFVNRSRGSPKYNASHLFGNLAGKRYYCRFDCPTEVIGFLIENIPLKNFDEVSFTNSLLRRLRSILPEEIFEQFEIKMTVIGKAEIKSKKAGLDYFL